MITFISKELKYKEEYIFWYFLIRFCFFFFTFAKGARKHKTLRLCYISYWVTQFTEYSIILEILENNFFFWMLRGYWRVQMGELLVLLLSWVIQEQWENRESARLFILPLNNQAKHEDIWISGRLVVFSGLSQVKGLSTLKRRKNSVFPNFFPGR